MSNTAELKLADALRASAADLGVVLPRDLQSEDASRVVALVEERAPDRKKALNRFKLLLELWCELPDELRFGKRPQLVILVHGIRTQAEWQDSLLESLAGAGRTIVPLKYEFFDIFKFLCPFGTRRAPILRLTREIRDAIDDNRDHELIIIAHGFGTFSISEILLENPDIQPSSLMLCGTIIKESFRWDTLKNVPSLVVNDCGLRDILPVLAKSVTWGFGASGRFGFGSYRVKDRFHDVGHSGCLNPQFANQYWKPILDGQAFVLGITRRPSTPLLVSILSTVRLRWIILACLIALSAYLILCASRFLQ